MIYAAKRPQRKIPTAKLPDPVWKDGQLTLYLPVPARACSPNARRGESRGAAIRKSKIIKAHRLLARLAMAKAILLEGLPADVRFTGYCLDFFFRTAAFRDDDNADASIKAYRDGIASALRMNDRDLRKCRLSTYQKDAECSRVEITLMKLADEAEDLP